MTTTLNANASPSNQLARLMDGYLMTQLLFVATQLGVAEALVDGPRASVDLARVVGAAPDPLHRILRGLAAEGVLDETADGRFGLTPLGCCLIDGAPGSLKGAIVARGGLYFRAAGELCEAVRAGDIAFERAHGDPFFTYVSRDPAGATAFQSSMIDRSRQEAVDVVAAYDFGHFRRLVDIGGGTGILLDAILAATPALVGVLFDRLEVIAQARARFGEKPLDGRLGFEAGDFFVGVTPGADAYLLSRVIHDWDDESALRILMHCRRAMAAEGTLLLVEAILPERAREQPAAIRMDLHMLLLSPGRERTAADFARLLSTAGFRIERVIPTGSAAGLGIIEARPAGDAPAND